MGSRAWVKSRSSDESEMDPLLPVNVDFLQFHKPQLPQTVRMVTFFKEIPTEPNLFDFIEEQSACGSVCSLSAPASAQLS